MRRILYSTILFLTVILLAFPARVVFAHVLKVDGNIGAVLHMDPADEPATGRLTTFYFEIKDKQSTFSPEKCICAVDLSLIGGASVHTASLFTAGSGTGLNSPALTYVFQQPGVYKATLTGAARSGEFKDFTLSWDFRVEGQGVGSPAHTNTAEHHNSGGNSYIYALGVGIIIVMYVIARNRNKKIKSFHSLTIFLCIFTISGALLFYNFRVAHVLSELVPHQHTQDETGHMANVGGELVSQLPVVVAQVFHGVLQTFTTERLETIPQEVWAAVPLRSGARAPPSLQREHIL